MPSKSKDPDTGDRKSVTDKSRYEDQKSFDHELIKRFSDPSNTKSIIQLRKELNAEWGQLPAKPRSTSKSTGTTPSPKKPRNATPKSSRRSPTATKSGSSGSSDNSTAASSTAPNNYPSNSSAGARAGEGEHRMEPIEQQVVILADAELQAVPAGDDVGRQADEDTPRELEGLRDENMKLRHLLYVVLGVVLLLGLGLLIQSIFGSASTTTSRPPPPDVHAATGSRPNSGTDYNPSFGQKIAAQVSKYFGNGGVYRRVYATEKNQGDDRGL
ncbi:unnamed protein product [Amoebophrya sp. A120]|nr:unnamed protein product [Amoebophrya sp. A120]|eukprot:GSA120T00019281001.1